MPTTNDTFRTNPLHRVRRLFRWRICLLTVLACLLPGCAVVGYLAAIFTPPEKIEPVYELPKDKIVLVLVDDPAFRSGHAPIKSELSREINRLLEGHRLVRRTIPYKKLLAYIATETNYNQMPTTEVGKALEADLVIVVEIDDFALKDDMRSSVYHGRLKTSVRVVSTRQGKLWPKHLTRGYPVKPVETPLQQGDGSSQFEIKLSRRLARNMAEKIVNLFFEHTGPEHSDLPESPDAGEP